MRARAHARTHTHAHTKYIMCITYRFVIFCSEEFDEVTKLATPYFSIAFVT